LTDNPVDNPPGGMGTSVLAVLLRRVSIVGLNTSPPKGPTLRSRPEWFSLDGCRYNLDGGTNGNARGQESEGSLENDAFVRRHYHEGIVHPDTPFVIAHYHNRVLRVDSRYHIPLGARPMPLSGRASSTAGDDHDGHMPLSRVV
jgi:hypothetical protein